jgi:ribosome maturation factor RimP
MITVAEIEQLVNAKIAETDTLSDVFVVSISVRPGNAIEVLLDKDSGLNVEDCKKVSRHVESSLDREKEDFSLEVSSPGVGKPLVVHRQYLKNVGRTVKVKDSEGEKYEGDLAEVSETGIVLKYQEKEVLPGKKKKEWVEKSVTIAFDNIKETKVVIRFN